MAVEFMIFTVWIPHANNGAFFCVRKKQKQIFIQRDCLCIHIRKKKNLDSSEKQIKLRFWVFKRGEQEVAREHSFFICTSTI